MARERNRVPDDDRVGPDPNLFDHQPKHALTIGNLEGVGGIMQLAKKRFQALGQRHVRLGVEEVRLQGGKLGLDRGFSVAQERHACPELIERDQLFLVGFDQAGHPGPGASQVLGRDVALHVTDMIDAQLHQPTIDFGAHERGIAEQLDDVLPDEPLHRVLPDGTIGTAAPLREAIGVGPHTAIIGEPTPRGACRVPVERIADS